MKLSREQVMEIADLAKLALTEQEIEQKFAEGFATGRYRPPSRPGIAYMLSPATYMMNAGKLVRTPPHTMFYAPFLTNTDIGGLPGKTAFVDRPGPHGVMRPGPLPDILHDVFGRVSQFCGC